MGGRTGRITSTNTKSGVGQNNFSLSPDEGYVSGTVTVTSSEVEARVGAARLTNRVTVRIFNRSTVTIFFGPTGLTTTTGEDLLPKQWVEVTIGDLGLFLIAASGSNVVVVQELA